MKGKFIVIEGVDGCGKSVMLEELKKSLTAKGKKVFVMNNVGETDVGDTTIAKAIRTKINTKEVANTSELVYLYLSAMISATEGVSEVQPRISNLLEEYDYVLCSRWIYSTMVYGMSLDLKDFYDGLVVSLIDSTYDYIQKPDLTLVIDASLNTILTRLSRRDTDKDYFSETEKLTIYHDRYANLKTYISQLFNPSILVEEWGLGATRIKYIDNNDSLETSIWLALTAIEEL